MLPPGTLATVDRSTWAPPPVFGLVQRLGRVPAADLERTLNLGVGFLAVLPQELADEAVARTRARGIDVWVAGKVVDAGTVDPDPAHEVTHGAKGVDGGSVQLVGRHPVT